MKTCAIVVAGTLASCTGTPGQDATETPTALPTTAGATATATASPTSDGQTAAPTASPTEDGPLSGAEECENEDYGYEVEYPAGWWANERIEPEDDNLTPIAACQFFAPNEVELQPNAGLPNGIAIRFDLPAEGVVLDGELLSEDEVTIDGHDARVVEREPTPSPGFVPEGSLVYQYIVVLDDGRELTAITDNILQDDIGYEDSKALLDAMMDTLEVDD